MSKLILASLPALALAIISGVMVGVTLTPVIERLYTVADAQAYILRIQLQRKAKPASVTPFVHRRDI